MFHQLAHTQNIPYMINVRDEGIIQVLGCEDCTGLGHGKYFVSLVAVARLGADVSSVFIDNVGAIDQRIDG